MRGDRREEERGEDFGFKPFLTKKVRQEQKGEEAIREVYMDSRSLVVICKSASNG